MPAEWFPGAIPRIFTASTQAYRKDTEGPALPAEFSFPASIALDQSGRVYFADENNNRIRVLAPVASLFNLFRRGPRR